MLYNVQFTLYDNNIFKSRLWSFCLLFSRFQFLLSCCDFYKLFQSLRIICVWWRFNKKKTHTHNIKIWSDCCYFWMFFFSSLLIFCSISDCFSFLLIISAPSHRHCERDPSLLVYLTLTNFRILCWLVCVL